MIQLKHVLLTAVFLAGPAFAEESSDPAMPGKEMIEQQQNASEDTNKADAHKNIHRKHLSKRPYKEHVEPNQEAKKAEAGSPHKNIYHKHVSKRPHSKNVSH